MAPMLKRETVPIKQESMENKEDTSREERAVSSMLWL